jgi:acetyl esterase/lipase
MKIRTIQLYPDRPDVTLTTYLLDDSRETTQGKKRPAVLVCPGGGYLFCSDREGEPIALRFAAMGYHAFVLRYSTYGGNRPDFDMGSPVETPDPRSIFPTSMRDLGLAMLTLKDHADEWLLDADRIALCGFSAGAHNCAMYAVSWNRPVLVDHFGVDPERLRPAAAILGYGLGDYVRLHGEARALDPFAARLQRSASIALFGVEEPDDATLEQLSPARQIGPHVPPMFLWTTSEDSLVPSTQSLVLALALAERNLPYELHVFEKGSHGLSLAVQASASSRAEIDPDAAKWVELVESWLTKRLALDLPEKPFWMA